MRHSRKQRRKDHYRWPPEVSDLADVAPRFESPLSNKMQMGESVVRGARVSEGSSFLDFDDLLRRCAHPNWDLDPRMNIFLNTEEGRIGRERFRTLRSRLYQIAATRPLKRVLVTSSVPSEGKNDCCRKPGTFDHVSARPSGAPHRRRSAILAHASIVGRSEWSRSYRLPSWGSRER